MSQAVDIKHFQQLEEGIWRNGSDWRDQMLTADFTEFCRLGDVYGRDHLLGEGDPTVEVEFPFEQFGAESLTEDVVLVTYENVVRRGGRAERARRSSIWVQDGDDWRLRFMQATTLEN